MNCYLQLTKYIFFFSLSFPSLFLSSRTEHTSGRAFDAPGLTHTLDNTVFVRVEGESRHSYERDSRVYPFPSAISG
jgi:hypothetical protein